jgi:shikimate kinase
MAVPDKVFLIGPMGAGKTTIGKKLASTLGLEFYDSDREIESSTGVDIGWIFDKEGEAGFRQRESAMIDELTQKSGLVLATGGGAVNTDEVRQYLSSRGYVVYLYLSVEEQFERTQRDRNRPLLQGDKPREVLESLMQARDPLYQEVSDLTIPTGGRTLQIVVKEIIKHLNEL